MVMGDNSKRYSGGCLCGAVRYEAEGEPMLAGHCYCADCRKASGSGFIPFMQFPSSAVSVRGPTLTFTSRAASGRNAARNSCRLCGSLVFGGEVGKSMSFTIYAGSLDDPSLFHPTVAIFVRGHPNWATIPPNLQTFDRRP